MLVHLSEISCHHHLFPFSNQQLKFKTSIMELELGLKITRTPHDFASASDVWIARNAAGPHFVSKETDTAIVLTGYLKGYRRENINIKINQHGTRIVISGEKPVQEMLMMGWIMLKKQVEIREFRKVFQIPDGGVLNRIKAKIMEDESVLTINFPKLIKGISGIVIEETEETDGRILEMERSGIAHEIPRNKEDEQILSVKETRQIAEDESREKQADNLMGTAEETNAGANAEQSERESQEENKVAERESGEAAHEIKETSLNIPTHEAIDEKEEQAARMAESAEEQTEETQKIVEADREEQKDHKNVSEIQQKPEKKTWNPFVIAGSAFLASSLFVVVLGCVSAKRKDKR